MTAPDPPLDRLLEAGAIRKPIESRSPEVVRELVEALPEALRESVQGFLKASTSKNTLRAYASDWRSFTAWCAARGFKALPAAPEVVAAYAADKVAKKYEPGRKKGKPLSATTVSRHLSAISQAHVLSGLDSPCESAVVKRTMRGIRREVGRPPEKKSPLTIEDLRSIVNNMPGTARGLRDRALILLGFAGAFRRSELVALDVDQLTFMKQGLLIQVLRSKTDQENEGTAIGVPRGTDQELCPVLAVEKWVEKAELTEGPLFLATDKNNAELIVPHRLDASMVNRIVKREAERLGLDPDSFGGHSLRAGMATEAHRLGKSFLEIMRQGRWKSPRIAAGYVHLGDVFEKNPTAGMFDKEE